MNWYPCVVCGAARYSHEVVVAPKLKAIPRITQWKQNVGETAVRRMLRHNQEAFTCIDHFEYNQLYDEFGQVKLKWKPIEISEEEKRVHETYFQDHGYFEIFRSDNERKIEPSLKTVSCSLCSMTVDRVDLESHAISHSPFQFEDHTCEKHTMNRKDAISCSECSFNQTKVAYELAHIRAEQCFKMFEFTLIKRQFAGEIVFSLKYHLKEEYIVNRPIWLFDDNLLAMNTGPPVKLQTNHEEEMPDVKLEPIGDYERSHENIEQSEMMLFHIDDGTPTKKKIKIEEEESLEEKTEETVASSVLPNEFISHVNEIIRNQDPDSNNQDLDSGYIKDSLELFYQINKHPTFEELNCLRGLLCCTRSFRDFFNFFERKRRSDNIVCPDNDTCRLALKFFEMEREPVGFVAKNPKVTKRMTEMFEEHLKNEKQFRNGHSYVIAQKLGLKPKYIRFCFSTFVQYKKAMKHWQTEKYIEPISEFPVSCQEPFLNENCEQFIDFSPEALQLLEKTYLKTKLIMSKLEWSKETIDSLSAWCGVSKDDILKWLQRRKYEDKEADPNKMKDWQKAILLSTFSRIPHPSREEFEILAKTVKAPVTCVMQWFSYKQNGPKWHELQANQTPNPQFLSNNNRSLLQKFIGRNPVVTMKNLLRLSKAFDVSVATVNEWIQTCMEEKQ